MFGRSGTVVVQAAALRLALENVSELFLIDYVRAKAEAVAQGI